MLLSVNSVKAGNFDENVNSIFKPIADFIGRIIFVSFDFEVGNEAIGVPIVLVLLVLAALYFTIDFNFINIRGFRTAIQIVRGKYDDPNEKGEVSHFQALTAALSGTVGLGNIAGVAIAVSLGGAGATFWMILAGLLGMSTKFLECTLGVKYRQIGEDGTVYGGPMYYLKQGFSDLKMNISGETKDYSKMGKVLSVLFALACIGGSFGGGNMFQVNQAYSKFSGMEYMQGTYIAENGWLFGVIVSALVAVVIIGGIKSIAKVTDKIVPFMCGIYVIAALVVIFYHIDKIGWAFSEIISGAFSSDAVSGGFVGVLLIGFKRAAFSNEAGIGSASIAHSAVKTNDPASEGLVSLLEPFIDTVLVCTMTALVIVITGTNVGVEVSGDTNALGVELTSNAFESVISWFPYLLTTAVVLFAFSTMVSWSYYGVQAWAFLFGRGKRAEYIYKAIFCLMVIVGASSNLGPVIDFSDCMIFLMCFPNILGLIFLAPVVKSELKKYMAKIDSGYFSKM